MQDSEVRKLCEEVEEYCSKATPGPWEVRPHEFDDWGLVRGGSEQYPVAKACAGEIVADYDQHRRERTDPYEHNAVFIARARTDLPKLVAALRELSGKGE